MVKIKNSVGARKGKFLTNYPAEVTAIINLLNRIPEEKGGTQNFKQWGIGYETRNTQVAYAIANFQSKNGLTADGGVDPGGKTLALMNQLAPPPEFQNITGEILGAKYERSLSNGLYMDTVLCVPMIVPSSYRKHDGLPHTKDPEYYRLKFLQAPATSAVRMGIFSAQKNDIGRALILMLPAWGGKVNRLCIGISHGFGQNAAKTYNALGWSNPYSPELIKFCLDKHVVQRWGAQTMQASLGTMGYLHIVRSSQGGKGELGPFASDGAFFKKTLENLASMTKN
jgi:peptidoglycan hydrolase-like protein with peptidoglycan-binding domain